MERQPLKKVVLQVMQTNGVLLANMSVKNKKAFPGLDEDAYVWNTQKQDADENMSGHAVCVIGMREQNGKMWLVCFNSYGESWGNKVDPHHILPGVVASFTA